MRAIAAIAAGAMTARDVVNRLQAIGAEMAAFIAPPEYTGPLGTWVIAAD